MSRGLSENQLGLLRQLYRAPEPRSVSYLAGWNYTCEQRDQQIWDLGWRTPERAAYNRQLLRTCRRSLKSLERRGLVECVGLRRYSGNPDSRGRGHRSQHWTVTERGAEIAKPLSEQWDREMEELYSSNPKLRESAESIRAAFEP